MPLPQDKFVLPHKEDASVSDFAAIEGKARELSAHYETKPWESFGNEIKSALLLSAKLVPEIDLGRRKSYIYDLPSLDRFYLRPSLEPIVYSSWSKLREWSIDDEWVLKTAKCLLGRAAHFRSDPIIKPRMGPVAGWQYMAPEEARQWRDAVEAVRNNANLPPVAEACAAYAAFAIYHPLKDGNGRIARALFHGVLANRLDLSAPIIPLGPAIYHYGHHFTYGFRQLALNGNWRDFFELMHLILANCCEMTTIIKRGISHETLEAA